MAQVTGTLGRPIQGVSQQPNNRRLKGQCTESINLVPDLVDGLSTREGSSLVSLLTMPEGSHGKGRYHFYRRDSEEAYIMFIPEENLEEIKVWNLKGEVQAVQYEWDLNEYLYRNGCTPYDLKIKSVGDTTFLVNPFVTTAMSEELSPEYSKWAVVYCQFIDFAQTQSIYIDDVMVATYSSMDGTESTTAQKESVKTSKVMHSLATQLGWEDPNTRGITSEQTTTAEAHEYRATAYGGPILVTMPEEVPNFESIVSLYSKRSGYFSPEVYSDQMFGWRTLKAYGCRKGDTVTIKYITAGGVTSELIVSYKEGDNVLFVRKADNSDFTIRTSDDADGGNLIAVKGTVSDLSKLPPKAPANFVVKVAADGAADSADWWVEYFPLGENEEDGFQWRECVAPNTQYIIDNTTMPLTLVRTGFVASTAQFELQVPDWTYRKVGSADSNPDPSFIGYPISSLGLFQNRLFFTSSENIAMSVSSDFFNFFKETTQSVLATDPVDLYSDSDKVVDIRFALPFNGDLALFSEDSQMRLAGDKVVAPDDLSPIQTMSSFKMNGRVDPVASGENILFAYNHGNYTGIREMFIDSLVDTQRARPITDHVNKYLKGEATIIQATTSLNKVVVKTDYDSTLYVYDYLWQGSDKVQSAWGKWTFDPQLDVVYFFFDNTTMYVILQNNKVEEYYLISLELGVALEDTIDSELRLDMVTKVGSRSNADGSFTIPNDNIPYYMDNLKFIAYEGQYPEYLGMSLDFKLDGTDYKLDAGLAERSEYCYFLVGVPISVKYEPSQPYPHAGDGNPMGDLYRFQVSKMLLKYDKADFLKATVVNSSGSHYVYPLSTRKMNNSLNIIGQVPKQVSGSFTIPVRSREREYTLILETDSHLPLQLESLQYLATYSPRGEYM